MTSHDPGNTPLSDDELEGIVPPHLVTRAELNQWEASNIARAQEWAVTRAKDVLDVKVLQDLHRRMFDETWDWAGRFRRSDKNISPYHWAEVPRLVRDLVENTRVQYDHSARTPKKVDEIAVRFHHGLVRIHPWPNGNGRHARLGTDMLLRQWERPSFTWGSEADLAAPGTARASYLKALRAADGGGFRALFEFARS